MSYFVVGQGLMSNGAAPPPFHENVRLDHKAKSRKQQQAQDNSFEG
jgi:hypothetical protein